MLIVVTHCDLNTDWVIPVDKGEKHALQLMITQGISTAESDNNTYNIHVWEGSNPTNVNHNT